MSDLKEELQLVKKELQEDNALISQPEPPKNNQTEKVDNLVGDLLETAIVGTIKTDKETQDKVINTAKTIIDTKIGTEETKAKTENAKANFDNKKEACACFGFGEKEDTLPKKAVNAMNVIHNFWLAIWIGICAITLCPVNFVAKRMQNTIKKTWITIVIGVLVYFSVIIGLPTLLVSLVKGLVH